MTKLATGSDHDETHPMQFLLDEELNLPTAGEVRTGLIIECQDHVILVDIGAKSEGIIPNYEVETMDIETRKALAVGNEVPVYVVDPEDKNGNVILSYTKASEEQDWLKAAALLESQETYQGPVVGYNRGGLLIKVGQLRGFLPNSQLSRSRRLSREQITPQDLQELVGETISSKVIEVDRERNRLILSERAAGKEIREAKRADLLSRLQEGDVCEGHVVNLAEFGAFVDIGGIEGLVHLSEISWKHIRNPAEKLQLGDKVNVYVLNVDREQQRLALSLKRLEPDPWTLIGETYHVGQLVMASVTKLTKFGAFARINDEYALEGLIHISELSENHVNHPREVIKPSEEVTVRIIRIDPEQRQLGLSLKQVASDKFLETDLEMLAEV